MKIISLKRSWPFFLAVTALSLILVQPLWAVEESSAPQAKEESFFETIKRKTQEWWGSGNDTPKAPKQTEKKPQEKIATIKSDGRKAIDTVKKEMKKISDNVSESIERDKKNIKKKLDKLRGKK